jgi:nicotinate-nucleotide--dimethylbenzimidazole phosphoribosyltransferase
MTDAGWIEQVILIRDRISDLRAHQGDIEALLATVPGATEVVDALLTASARRTPVLLEGLTVWAGAVAADRLSFRAKTWWHGAGTSSDPAIRAAVKRIGVDPGLDLGLPTESIIGARVHAALIEMV